MAVETNAFLSRLNATVKAIEPGATVFLYGSRARQEAGPESDWDLLVLVEGDADRDRKARIRHTLYEVEWETGEVISPTIKSREDWSTPLMRATPFHVNVTREGILIKEDENRFGETDARRRRQQAREQRSEASRADIIAYRLERARESLQVAREIATRNRWNGAASQLYFACFYAAIAWLISKGLSSAKHTGVRSLVNQNLVRTGILDASEGELYNDLFELRKESDYQDFVHLSSEDVVPLIPHVEHFIDHIEQLLRD